MNGGFVYLGWRVRESKHEEKSEGERERFLYLISASSVGNVRNVLEDRSLENLRWTTRNKHIWNCFCSLISTHLQVKVHCYAFIEA